MRQDLGIAAAAETVALAHQVVAKRDVVVQLAVLNRDDRVVFVENRLMSPFDVHDRETADAAIPGPRCVPLSLGPRCVMVSVIASSALSDTISRASPCTWTTPQIPHTPSA